MGGQSRVREDGNSRVCAPGTLDSPTHAQHVQQEPVHSVSLLARGTYEQLTRDFPSTIATPHRQVMHQKILQFNVNGGPRGF